LSKFCIENERNKKNTGMIKKGQVVGYEKNIVAAFTVEESEHDR
jgi:hypothetical protein